MEHTVSIMDLVLLWHHFRCVDWCPEHFSFHCWFVLDERGWESKRFNELVRWEIHVQFTVPFKEYLYAFSLHLSWEGFCSVQLGFLTLWASGHSSRQQSLRLQQMRSPVKLALLLCHAWLISQEQEELHWLCSLYNPEWETVALSPWTGDTSADCQQIHCTCSWAEPFLLLLHASLQCWGL